MKQLKAIFFGLVVSVAMMACGGEAAHDNDGDYDGHEHGQEATEAKPHGATKEYTSAYVCPMHCPESGSDQPGKCPVCGMDYEKLEDHAKNGHVH